MEINEKRNHLTLLYFTEPKVRINGIKRKRGMFRCDCGNEKIYDFTAVNIGYTKQCIACGRVVQGKTRLVHGLIKHPLYRKWQDMKNRCYNPKVWSYKSYGARGITVCNQWIDDFTNYYNWCLDNGWKSGLQMERDDVNGNYCPENCRFITAVEQGFNKRNTFYVTIQNEKYSLAKLMYENHISSKYGTVWGGLKKGKTIEYYIEKLQLKTHTI